MADLPVSQANAQRIRNTLTQISAYSDDNKSVVPLPIEDAKLTTSWLLVLDKFFNAVVIDQLHPPHPWTSRIDTRAAVDQHRPLLVSALSVVALPRFDLESPSHTGIFDLTLDSTLIFHQPQDRRAKRVQDLV